MCKPIITGPNPKHLIVISHGYMTHYSRLYYLAKFFKLIYLKSDRKGLAKYLPTLKIQMEISH